MTYNTGFVFQTRGSITAPAGNKNLSPSKRDSTLLRAFLLPKGETELDRIHGQTRSRKIVLE